MSWKPEVRTTDNPGKWFSNGLRFAAEEEARFWAQDLAMRWFAVLEFRAAESGDPVNYSYLGGELIDVAKPGSV